MQGIVFALFSGLFIALQGIFNARLGDAVGPWLSVTIVHFVGLMGCLLIYGFVRDRKIGGFRKLPLIYASGGLLGVLVVVTELTSIQLLGMTWAMSLLLVAQILCAFVIDLNGWFGVIKKSSNRGQWVGVVFCVMRGIQLLGPSIAISVVLISQLSFALCVDVFGWFGLPQVDLSLGQIAGLAVMLTGIFVLKRYQVVDEAEQAEDVKAIS